MQRKKEQSTKKKLIHDIHASNFYIGNIYNSSSSSVSSVFSCAYWTWTQTVLRVYYAFVVALSSFSYFHLIIRCFRVFGERNK